MASDNDRFASYLRDLGCLLKENALESRRNRDTAGDDDKPYSLGHLMAYHEVVSLMQQQALAFGIDLEDICLADLEPESELI